MFEYFVVIVTM